MPEGTSLADQAKEAALKDVRAQKPSRFTVGGAVTRDGRIVGGITYDRKLTNLWGFTAYARAYWNDEPVHTHSFSSEAGFEFTRTFEERR